jgi:hypothetical protein
VILSVGSGAVGKGQGQVTENVIGSVFLYSTEVRPVALATASSGQRLLLPAMCWAWEEAA